MGSPFSSWNLFQFSVPRASMSAKVFVHELSGNWCSISVWVECSLGARGSCRVEWPWGVMPTAAFCITGPHWWKVGSLQAVQRIRVAMGSKCGQCVWCLWHTGLVHLAQGRRSFCRAPQFSHPRGGFLSQPWSGMHARHMNLCTHVAQSAICHPQTRLWQ